MNTIKINCEYRRIQAIYLYETGEVTKLPDAIYVKDTLHFKKLSSITGIFDGISTFLDRFKGCFQGQ